MSCKEHPRTDWEVTARHQRTSAFDGYRTMGSDYSDVRCRVCRASWRTKAAYVESLPDAPANWWSR